MKRVTLEQLPSIVSSLPKRPRVIVSGNVATPHTLLSAFDAAVPEYILHVLNAQPGLPDRDGVTHETGFVGPGMRKSTHLAYVPTRLSMLPVLFHTALPPDVVLLHASAQRHDTVSLGIEVNVLPAAIEATRARGGLVIVASNPQMPYTYGDAQIYDTEIDYLIEIDEPLTALTPRPLDDLARQIGATISEQILDGSTLQLGIGAIPDAVLVSLVERRGLRIWSEMFSDGVLTLEREGCLNPEIPLTASFLFGSHELYDFVNLNQRVRMMRTERTNDPGQIARQPRMTSVNAALQVDLYDQANASRIGGRIFSGFGGSTDFIVGAMHAREGQAFIALPSWHPKANVSTIVPIISEPVTSFQHTAVVTEQGLARVFGNSQAAQAREIIGKAAHPSARDELTAYAETAGLLGH